MGKAQTTIQVKIDGEISALQSKLTTAKQGLDKLGDGESTKGLKQQFTSLETAIKEIQNAVKQPLNATGMEALQQKVDSLGNDFDELIGTYKKLKKETSDNKLELLSPDTRSQIQAINRAINDYSVSMKEAKDKQEQLNSAKREESVVAKQITANQREQEANLKRISTLSTRQAEIQKKIKSSEAQRGKIDGRSSEAIALKNAEKALNDEFKSNKQTIDNYRKTNEQLTTDSKELTIKQTELKAVIESLGSEFSESAGSSQAQRNAYQQLYQAANQLGISLEDIDKEYSKSNADKLLSKLKALEQQGFDNLDKTIDKNVANLKECANEQKRLSTATQNTTNEVKEQDRAMENVSTLQGRISQYIGMEGIINALSQSLRDAFETVKQLDESMKDMAVVTDLDIGDYWDQLPEYTSRAQDLGLAINDVYQADMLYYQQGLKQQEVLAVSTETMKMAKIAGLETADATDRMTAALRGFNMEINEVNAQRISDVYSELAAITASDVDEISTAMTKTASIAASAGMEFETTAAFLSQIVETTREAAETAGTALKTVIARFQELKKDPSEIGEIDGEIVDANKIETALRSVGVALRDSSGQFRDLDDVFLELASKWDDLDKNTQRYIATIAAGSRQQSRFIAMMSDYSRTQELVAAANNSAGASNKQFEKTLESLETKLNKLSNAWNTFTMGIMDDKLVKFGIDLLTGLLNAMNKLFDAMDVLPFGGLIGRVGVLIGGLLLLDKVIHKFFVSMQNGNSILKSAGAALMGYSLNTEGARISTGKLSMQERLYISTLNQEQAELYETIVAKKISRGASESEAKSKAKQIVAENVYVKSLNKEGLSRYNLLIKQFKNNGATKEEARVKAKAIIATEIKAGANLVEEKTTKKSTWATIKKTIADKAQKTWAVLCAFALGMKAAFTKKDMAATLASLPADYSKTAAIAGMVAVVLLAIAAFAGLVIGILALCGVFNTATKQLEKATKELESTSEAATKVREEYDALNESLDNLDSKYDTLKELQRGTKEWNKAVQETNDSVLDLIEQYPALSELVENKGGVLTLDIESDAVQDVLQQKEKQATLAKGAEIGAKMRVAELNTKAEYENSTQVIDDFSNRSDDAAGVWTGIGTALGGAGAGALAGLAIGGPIGALVGAIVGLVGGAVVGVNTGLAAKKATLRSDEIAKGNIDKLSKAYASGKTGTSREDIVEYIEHTGMATGAAAEKMADAFLKNKDALLEYGKSLNQAESQMEAYYNSIAVNAQQLLDQAEWTQGQLDQMSNVVSSGLVQRYQENEEERLNNLNKEEFNNEKLRWAKETYGENVRVDGNKILDEKGEVLLEFENEDGWKAQMAAANSLQKAAEAMEQVPDMIAEALESGGFSKDISDALYKIMSGESLTKAETDVFNELMSDVTYYTEDGETELGSKETVLAEFNADKNLQSQYGTFENYLNSLDADYNNLKAIWDTMDPAKKQAIYGGTDDKAYELFEAEFKKDNEATNELWYNAEKIAKQLGGLEISAKIDDKSADAWMKMLASVAPSGGDVGYLNTALGSLLSSENFTYQEVAEIMSYINSMDVMDINQWEGLRFALEEMGYSLPTDKLNTFIDAGKDASGAIEKINLATFAEDVRQAYQLLDKIKEGGRTYSQEDYQKLVLADPSLEKSFTQVGDQFVYVGNSIKDLENAVQKNTIALVGKAAKQAQDKYEMAGTIAGINENYRKTTGNMTREELQQYLIEVRDKNAAFGNDIGLFGIPGLSAMTDFVNDEVTTDVLREWVEAIRAEGANEEKYKREGAESVRDGMVQWYSHNRAAYNAEMGISDSEYADEHRDALIQQAITSGGVSEEMIEAYKNASDAYAKDSSEANKEVVKDLGKKIADATDKIVEENNNRDAYQDLVERVSSAIEKLRQDEIDKLSTINDSVNDANDQLLNKIQEQINDERQRRDNAEKEENLQDLAAKVAYLGMDTANGNSLELLNAQKELEDARQDYEDELVDQALEKLSDANERAAEQREEQINILHKQLDYERESGRLTKEADEIVQSSLNEFKGGTLATLTELGKILLKAETAGFTEEEAATWESNLQKATVSGSNYISQKGASPKQNTGVMPNDDTPIDPGEAGNDQNELDRKRSNQQAVISGYISHMDESMVNVDDWYDTYVKHGGPLSKEEFIKEAYGQLSEHDISIMEGQGNDFVAGYDAFQRTRVNESLIAFPSNRFKTEGVYEKYRAPESTQYILNNLAKVKGLDSSDTIVALYDQKIWVKDRYDWVEAPHFDENSDLKYYNRQYTTAMEFLKKNSAFKTGGLADFTGPAWLDGTPNKPEYILNAVQTERFFSLIDVLEGFDKKSAQQKATSDITVDVDINVENISSDYDVERMADKIREMLYNDSMYRNVNQV